jgi:hypothetical protein
MSLFNWLKGNKNADVAVSELPHIRFGRHSGYYKSATQHEAWDNALNAFEEGDYMESYRKLFEYLGANESTCVSTQELENNSIDFEVIQGSKRIVGNANCKKIRAEIDIAKADTLNVAFMRRLLEHNNGLTYGRFVLDDENHLRMVFDTAAVDASPYKLFYAFKEIAINSDKQDDLLIEQFKMLRETDENLKIQISEAEKEAKYDYILASIQQTLTAIDNNRQLSEQYPGSVTYLLLDVLYRVDYLTCPEGFSMDILESAHRLYKTNDKTILQKNIVLRKELERLLLRKREDYYAELYRADYAFEINPTVSPDALMAYIDEELRNTEWYMQQSHFIVSLAISNMIVGSILFNYTPIKPIRQLLHLYFHVVENPYFRALGFSAVYENEAAALQNKPIQDSIQQILTTNKKEYPNLKMDFTKLQYNNKAAFAKSFLMQLRQLDFLKKD